MLLSENNVDFKWYSSHLENGFSLSWGIKERQMKTTEAADANIFWLSTSNNTGAYISHNTTQLELSGPSRYSMKA